MLTQPLQKILENTANNKMELLAKEVKGRPLLRILARDKQIKRPQQKWSHKLPKRKTAAKSVILH
jgi:hypothetical protein